MTTLDLTRSPKTNPADIYRYRDGIYAVDLIIVGVVEFDLVTWLDQNPGNLEAVCDHFQTAPRPTDVMLTLFAANGIITKKDGVYEVTEVGREHLVRSSEWYLGPYYASLMDRPVCRDLISVLKTDKPANWGSSKGLKEWSKAMEGDEFATQFTAAMDCRGLYLAQAAAKKLNLSGARKFLDIAGGSGIYACSFAAHFPKLEAAVFERPPVDQIARTMIQKRGFEKRVEVIAGDMFTNPLPEGYDIHLFSNVLHDWDVTKVAKLLAKSWEALEPGGTLIIHDAHLNEKKDGPLPVAEYSVILMHSTEGRCYGVTETFELLKEAGFHSPTFQETAADRSVITARK
jgi:SAM-dependent methyltransferase